MKICISPSHSNSLKCFLIFPCWFSLTESSFSPFKTNRILVGLQTHYKYLFMGIYRCWSCSGSSKLRLRFCMGFPWELYFIVSSKLSVFKRPKQLHRNLSNSYFVAYIQAARLWSYLHYLALFSLLQEKKPPALSALPAGLRICICSQCTSTHRVARSLLSPWLCAVFSCSTDNSVSKMGLSSPPFQHFQPR